MLFLSWMARIWPLPPGVTVQDDRGDVLGAIPLIGATHFASGNSIISRRSVLSTLCVKDAFALKSSTTRVLSPCSPKRTPVTAIPATAGAAGFGFSEAATGPGGAVADGCATGGGSATC